MYKLITTNGIKSYIENIAQAKQLLDSKAILSEHEQRLLKYFIKHSIWPRTYWDEGTQVDWSAPKKEVKT